ncbi:MAG: hypothetical protein IIB65_06240 [Proteobacteria bacterium]|nr:hypothetical protein [Pseudomonadota bacterium]
MAKDLPLHERIVAKINQPGVSLADRELDSDVRDWIDTQAASLNLVIGQKGIPVGRLTLLVGHEATGKSTALVHLIAETQRRGGTAVLIDDENRWSRDRAAIIGQAWRVYALSGRTLATLRRAGDILAIGAAYAAQRVDSLPEEASDQRLDWVVTEEGAIRTGGETA